MEEALICCSRPVFLLLPLCLLAITPSNRGHTLITHTHTCTHRQVYRCTYRAGEMLIGRTRGRPIKIIERGKQRACAETPQHHCKVNKINDNLVPVPDSGPGIHIHAALMFATHLSIARD